MVKIWSHRSCIWTVWRNLPILLSYSFIDVTMAIETVNGCVGSHALFNCDILPDPGGDKFISLQWRFDSSLIALVEPNRTFIRDDYKDRLSLTWRTLKLTKLNESDVGQYACAVRYVGGSERQNITLNAYELQDCALPEPSLYLNGSLINNNQTAILSRELYIISTNAPQNNPPAVNVTYEVDLGFGKHVFHTCSQIGDTECQTWLQGDLNRTILVAVKVIFTHPVAAPTSVEWSLPVLDSPLFVGKLEDMNVTIHQNLSVPCDCMSKPAAQISWLNADESSALPADIFSVERRDSDEGNYQVTTGVLEWNPQSLPTERKQKGGRIKCRATNNLSEPIFSNTINLDVHYPPYAVNVEPPTKGVVEFGYLPEVKCSASCNPPCTYSWQGPADDSFGGNLQIVNVTREDHGHYKCMASNNLPKGDGPSTFSLVVFYGPDVKEFTVTPSSRILNKSEAAIFNCNVDSRPESNMTLLNPDGIVLHSLTSVNNIQYTFSNIDCLNSGVYHCETRNAITKRVNKTPLHVAVQCPPRKFTSSSNTVGAVDGDTVSFTITTIAFPEPKFTWNFYGSVVPGQSGTTVFGITGQSLANVFNKSTLELNNITKKQFGNYSVVAENSLGKMAEEIFMLFPAGPPEAPTELMKYHTNAVSITMQWTSGWNRGGEQVFTLMYRRSDSDDSYISITDISDPGQGKTVTSKAVGLLPDTSYDFMVLAKNQFGYTPTLMTLASSEADPQLDADGSLLVTISDNTATIEWSLHDYSGPITHVEINCCDVISTICFNTAVLNITSAVEAAVPKGGSSYTFVFRVYDGEDLLLNVNHFFKIDTRPSTGLVIGVVVAVVLLCATAAIIGVITWRKRRVVKGEGKNQDHSRKYANSNADKSYENTSSRGWEIDNMPVQQDLSPYEQIEDSADMILSAPNVYERPQAPQSVVVPAVYETLHPDNTVTTEAAGPRDTLELSEYANMN